MRNSSDGWLLVDPEDFGQNDSTSLTVLPERRESLSSQHRLPTTNLPDIPKRDDTPQNLPPFYESVSPPSMSSGVEEDVGLDSSTLVEYSSIPSSRRSTMDEEGKIAPQFSASTSTTTSCLTPISGSSKEAIPPIADQTHGTSHVSKKQQEKHEGQNSGGGVMDTQTSTPSAHTPVMADVERLFPAQTKPAGHIYPSKLNECDLHDIGIVKEFFGSPQQWRG